MSAPTVFLFAGEASGDLHGGALAAEIRRLRPDARLFGVGGGAMRQAGVELLYDYDRFAVLGLAEVIGHLPFFIRTMGEFEAWFRTRRPDLFIPIDYPDFNMRLADRARRAGVPVLYYISPQVWAWRPGRVRTLSRLVDRMVVVFPFETALYEAAGVPVTFVGHPLLERLPATPPAEPVRSQLGVTAGGPLVALLPGSRRQELRRILPAMIDAGRRLAAEGVTCAVSRAPGLPADLFGPATAAGLPVWSGAAADLVAAADLAIVTSGTATLETGLIGTPLIVVYRMSNVSWQVARRLVKMPYVGLVNIASGRAVVPELLQNEVTGERIADESRGLLADPARLAAMRRDLAPLRERLGGPGASRRTAELALELVDRKR